MFGWCSCCRDIRGCSGGGGVCAPEWRPPPGLAFVRAREGGGPLLPGPFTGVTAGLGMKENASGEGELPGGSRAREPLPRPARLLSGTSPVCRWWSVGRQAGGNVSWPCHCLGAGRSGFLKALPGREADSLLKRWLLRAVVALSLSF